MKSFDPERKNEIKMTKSVINCEQKQKENLISLFFMVEFMLLYMFSVIEPHNQLTHLYVEAFLSDTLFSL